LVNGADAAIRRCLIFSAVCWTAALLLRLVDGPVAENPAREVQS
jgi:hypothetical protein